MPFSARLGLLALGVSALPFLAHAEPARPQWVFGIDASVDDPFAVDFSGRATGVAATAAVHATALPVRAAPIPIILPGSTGPGVLVAVVDTGIDLSHSEFAGRIAPGGTCFGGPSVCFGLGIRGNDDQGHGTHVAGIIGAAANGVGTTGVAPAALLLPVKVLDSGGFGGYPSVISGISYAASHRARVINMSFGGPMPQATDPMLASLQQAARTAVIVAAAGNDGNGAPLLYPAAYATEAGVVGRMIIAGSVDATNTISSFSQTPGTGGCLTVIRTKTCYKDVFLVAPGDAILSTAPGGGYATHSGTSMAAPYISGVAARVLQTSPFLTPQQVVSILLQSATDLGAPGTDGVYGRGLVNLSAALAPLGVTSIATSGANTAGFTGTGAVGSAGVAGVLGAGLRGSTVAKSAVFFDSYGRDYRTDLTAAIAPGATSIEGFLTQDGLFRSVSFAGNGFSLSGLVPAESENTVVTAGLSGKQAGPRDVVLRGSLSDDFSLTVGRDASLAGHVNTLDLAASDAYGGLFISATAMNSPYLALSEGATIFAGSYDIGNGVTLTAGHAQTMTEDRIFADETLSIEELPAYLAQDLTHIRSAANTVVAASWRFAPWGVAGFNVARTDESNGVLGSLERGALALTADAVTTSVGFSARANLGGDWVLSASWSRGETDVTPLANGLFESVSALESEAYGIALSKRGVFGPDDIAGFAISRPLHVTNGSAVVTASTGVTETRDILYTSELVNLASLTPETDYEFGYMAKLDARKSLQLSAMYQQDAGGQKGTNAVAAFTTLRMGW